MPRLRTVCLTCFISMLLISLCGCSTEPITSEGNYVFGQDDQYYFDKPNVDFLSMAESESGYYFFSGPNNYYLYYMDKTTMKPVILCNKPNCPHTNETNPEKVLSCNACFFNTNTNLIYYNKKLYTIYKETVQSIDDQYSLYEISLDGTSRKKVFSFKDHPTNVIIHRGSIYFTVNDNGTQSGNEAKTLSKCRLYRHTIATNSDAELLYEYDGIYANPIKLEAYGNRVYLGVGKYVDSSLQEQTSVLLSYNINTKDINTTLTNIGLFNLSNHGILYNNIRDFKTYLCGFDGSDSRCIFQTTQSHYCDDEYIYLDNAKLLMMQSDANVKRQIELYDYNGNKVLTQILDIDGPDPLYGGNRELFVPNNASNSNEYGDIKTLSILKDKQYKRVFEYIPSIQFPGIIVSN